MFFKKAEHQIMQEKLLSWSQQQGAKIHFASLATSSDFSRTLIVYPTEAELKQHIESGLTERTKVEFVRIVKDVIGEYDFAATFEFDSHENVKRTHNGNYFHRCRE